MKTLYFCFIFFAMTSCNMYSNITKDLSILKIGMSKEDVYSRIGRPDQMVGAKKYTDGIIEILEYTIAQNTRIVGDTPSITKFWFFFVDNKLDEWGPRENYTLDLEHYYNQHHLKRHQ